jgi:hypothetical protein
VFPEKSRGKAGGLQPSDEQHVVYRTANAALQGYPYPHIYVREIFPPDFYRELQAQLPSPEDMRPIEEVRRVKGYKERFVLGFADADLAVLPPAKQAFWRGLRDRLLTGNFARALLTKYESALANRFTGKHQALTSELLLVEDVTDYKLGPHTDAPRKVVTVLFYLPADDSQRHLGTSIYVPKDPAFRCPGGPHHPHEGFDRAMTAPFMPNTLFSFFKTDNSFHGVEPILDAGTRRWLLLFDIYLAGHDPRKPSEGTPAPAEAPAPPPRPAVKFSF